MKKIHFTFGTACVAVMLFLGIPFLVAQDIDLPSVTTTITGDAQEIPPEALPDFSQVLPKTEEVLPQIPDSRFSPEENALDLGNGGMNENNMYLEGYFGGGFPGLFVGDFSVYKTSPTNPFTVHFMHLAHNGYGINNSASDGFFDSITQLDGSADFSPSEVFTMKAEGSYLSTNTGLQNNSPSFSSLSVQQLDGAFDTAFNFGQDSKIYGNLDGYVHNQYASVKNSLTESPSNLSFIIKPSTGLLLSGNFLSFFIDADYSFMGAIQQTSYTHRASVHSGLQFSSEIIDTGASVGGVFLENSQIVPFTIFVAFRGQTDLSDKDLSISLSGGLDSFSVTLPIIQEKHLYTTYDEVLSEQSDWFAKMNFFMPFGSVLSTNIDVDFRSTALNNGVLMPDYEQLNEVSGLYNLSIIERNALVSDLSLKYSHTQFSLSLGWKASWLDTSLIDQKHLVYLSTYISSVDSKWQGQGFVEFEPLKDLVPAVTMNTSYKITPSFILELELEDVIKLITGKDRTIVAPYVSRGGSASIIAKFYF